MWNLLRVGMVIIGVVAAVASAGAPKAHPVQRVTTVPRDFEATWTALIDLFAERGWAIGHLSKDSGLITTDWMNADADADAFADCGGTGLSVAGRTEVRFNVRAKPAGAGTELSVNTTFRQARTSDGQRYYADCTSRGVVEEMIHRNVSSAVSAAKGEGSAAPTSTAPAPRGFYCAAAGDAGLCTREKADCERARDAVAGAVELEPCRIAEAAWCAGERCAPTQGACERFGAGAACEERR